MLSPTQCLILKQRIESSTNDLWNTKKRQYRLSKQNIFMSGTSKCFSYYILFGRLCKVNVLALVAFYFFSIAFTARFPFDLQHLFMHSTRPQFSLIFQSRRRSQNISFFYFSSSTISTSTFCTRCHLLPSALRST